MKRLVMACVLLGSMVTVALVGVAADHDDELTTEESRIKRGFEIAPVPLHFRRSNHALVGLGSYIVNAQADCAGCHSFPQFVPGGDPFNGEPTVVATDTYLSGGAPFFGDFVPRNLTPNSDGKPAGLTFEQFMVVMRTGRDTKHREPHAPSADNDLLQVMPWPAFRWMVNRDLRAIYEYLKAIPCIGSAMRCGP